jgi:hypothetical protein
MRVVYDPRATVTRAIAPTSSSTGDHLPIGEGRIGAAPLAAHREQIDAFNQSRLIAFICRFIRLVESDLGGELVHRMAECDASQQLCGTRPTTAACRPECYDLRLGEDLRKRVELIEVHGPPASAYFAGLAAKRSMVQSSALSPTRHPFRFCRHGQEDAPWDGHEQTHRSPDSDTTTGRLWLTSVVRASDISASMAGRSY